MENYFWTTDGKGQCHIDLLFYNTERKIQSNYSAEYLPNKKVYRTDFSQSLKSRFGSSLIVKRICFDKDFFEIPLFIYHEFNALNSQIGAVLFVLFNPAMTSTNESSINNVAVGIGSEHLKTNICINIYSKLRSYVKYLIVTLLLSDDL